MIIDARCRPPAPGFSKFFDKDYLRNSTKRFGTTLPPSFLNDSMEMFFDEMHAAGITKSIIVGRQGPNYEGLGSVDNTTIANLVKEHPDEFVGVAGLDSANWRKLPRQVEECVSQGFVAVSVEPGVSTLATTVDDARLYPFYAACEELGTVVFTTISPKWGHDASYGSPIQVSKVASEFPDLKVAVAHAGWPFISDMIGVTFRHKNVFLVPDMYLHAGMPGSEQLITAADKFLGDRMIFGTAYPARPMSDTAIAKKTFSHDAEFLEKYLYKNIKALLKL